MIKYFLITLVFVHLNVNSTQAAPTRVIIDPGHGGTDHGAVYFGVKESVINLKVAKLLNQLLISDKRFSPQLTRNNDKNLSLEGRSDFAHKKRGEVFVSLHSNSFKNPKTHGAEFYFQNQLPPDEEAMFLASKEILDESSPETHHWPLPPVANYKKLLPDVSNIVQDLQLNYRILLSSQLAESLTKSWRGNKKTKRHSIKQAPFHVISNVSMPSTLIEMGYLTNKADARKLNTKSYQKTIAHSIYNGLINYIDKSPINDLD